jgi:FKBP-type peptidyl-prolyl cis-trans isomerase FkpA
MFRAVPLLTILALAAGCGGKSETAPSTSSAPYSQVDLVVGSGATAEIGRSVTVDYTLWLYDSSRMDGKGTLVEQSPPAGFTFAVGVGQVIRGWDQGVPGMRVGGRRRLIVPPDLAYGNRSPGSGIPPNATLVFEITLTAVS